MSDEGKVSSADLFYQQYKCQLLVLIVMREQPIGFYSKLRGNGYSQDWIVCAAKNQFVTHLEVNNKV